MSFIKWAIVLAIGIFIGMSFASAALADDIISYYKLDESSGDVVDELGTYDGTNYGATRGVAGIINDAFDFDDDYVRDFGESLLENDFTVNVWVTTEEASSQNYAVGQSVSASGHYRFMIGTSGDQLYMRQHRGGGTSDATGSTQMTYDGSVWYMMTFVSNSTGAYGYLNGGLEASIIEGTALYSGINQGLTFGVKYYNSGNRGGPWEGKLDEIGIWDRQLSEAEIIALYNSGAGESFPFDGYVNLHSPADDYVSPTTSVDFNATAFANVAQTFVNMTLYHNASGTWTAIETQSITGIENTTNWTDTFSDGDDFIWGVQACDTATCFFSVNRSLIVDMTNPIIDIITPVNGTLFDLFKEVGNTQDINFTITDTNLDTCWYEYNGVNTTFGTGGNCEIIEVGQDLIAYYKLDETTGVVVDELGNYDGTNYGSTRGVAGIINDAFDFSNDYVEIDDVITNYSTSTINLWMKTTTSTRGGLIGNDKSGKNDDYIIELDSGTGDCDVGEIFLQRADSDTASDYSVCSDGVVNDGNWHMVTAIANSSGMFLYIDGVIQTDWDSFSEASTNQGGWVLGSNGLHLLNRNYTGTLDEVGIWESSLTEAEIVSLYNSGIGMRPSGILLQDIATLPLHELTIYANDTAGNVGSNYTIWEYDVFVTNQTWNDETSEGAVEPFTLNATLGTGLTFNSATLTYNGTDYAGTITNTGGTDYYIDTEIDISNVDAEEEREFYWNLALSNGESYNTSTQTQNVTALFIDDCTSFGTLILNYTLYDEDTQDLISPDPAVDNATIEINIDVSPLGSTTPIIEYSNTFETNNATICMDNLETNYRLDVTTKYSAFDHVVEYHHIQNYQLNSSSEQHISLYDLATTESQEFLVVFKDENFVLVQDALIDISREYVGEGLFKSVEVAKTDSQGQTIVHLVLGDVRYDIVVKKEGEILATFDNVVAVCQDAGSGECTLNLNQLATQVQPLDYENLGNIAYYWTLDRADRTIQVDFTSTDSLVVKVDLNVTKFDNYFNESVCDETLTSTTGTITCNIPANFGNVSFLAEIYSDGEFVGQTLFSLSPQALESFGYTGVIMVIIMFMVLPLMFVSSPVGMVFGGIIAIVMMGLLSMFDYGGTLLGSGSMIMWFIVAGLILVWRMSKGGKSQ